MGNIKKQIITDKIIRWFDKEVELIVYEDSGEISIGKKRNDLLWKYGTGLYRDFIDDDDIPSMNYISLILEKIKENPDCITFKAERYIKTHDVIYKTNISKDQNLGSIGYRLPNHLCVFKAESIEGIKFPETSFGEDSAFAKLVKGRIKKVSKIDDVLYYYINSGTGASNKKSHRVR